MTFVKKDVCSAQN